MPAEVTPVNVVERGSPQAVFSLVTTATTKTMVFVVEGSGKDQSVFSSSGVRSKFQRRRLCPLLHVLRLVGLCRLGSLSDASLFQNQPLGPDSRLFVPGLGNR